MVDEVQKALTAQGHRATGRLIDTADYRVRLTLKKMTIDVELLDYYIKVERGQAPGTRVSVNTLMKWLRAKKFSGNKTGLRIAAFNISRAIFREGSPTKGSLKFSSTGKRTGFLGEAMRAADSKIKVIAERELEKIVQKQIDTILLSVK